MENEKLILSLETSGRKGSIALSLGSNLLEEKSFSAEMRHGAELFPSISALLTKYYRKACDISEVYISAGPGSFTGLRIAVSTAKTISYANSSKIVALSTLDVIAENAFQYIQEKNLEIETIGVILDAKRGDFYTSAYRRETNVGNKIGNWEKIQEDCLINADDFCSKYSQEKKLWLLGEGLVYYKGKFEKNNIKIFDPDLWFPKAGYVYKLGLAKSLQGEFEDPILLQPRYIREPDFTIKK